MLRSSATCRFGGYCRNARDYVGQHLPSGNPYIFVVRADGGVPRRLTTYAGDDVTPSWSRDGTSIYFASNRSGEYEVWKVQVSGESASAGAVRITHGGGFAPMESRDGRYLYFTKSLARSGLWRLELSDGQNSREQLVLARTGRESRIEVPDMRTGTRIDFGSLDKPVSTCTRVMAISPNGRSLVYEQLDQQDSDIMMVENFGSGRN